MSTTSTILGETHIGGKRQAWGTFATTSTETTLDVTTGLSMIEGFTITPNAASVTVLYSSVDETFPCKDGITILFSASADGYWTAIGQ